MRGLGHWIRSAALRRHLPGLCAVLCMVGCSSEPPEPLPTRPPPTARPAPAPDPPAPAPPEEPADEPLAEGSGEEPEPLALDPIEAEETPSGVVVADIATFWTLCDDAVQARVSRHRVTPDGPTVLERLDAGWVARSIDFLSEDDTFEGSWGCRRAEERVEVAYVTRVFALSVGPRFFYDPAADAVTPANWLGRIILADDPEAAARDRTSRRAALQTLASCELPNGVPLTSGLFIAAQRLGQYGAADAFFGWFVLPDTIVGDEVRTIVALQRRGSTGPVATTFELQGDACVPLDDDARSAWQVAASIVRGDPFVSIDGIDRGAAPSSTIGNANRAFAWVLNRRAELQTFEDFLAFYRTNRAYRPIGWQSLGPDDDRRFLVVHQFELGTEALEIAWSVDPVSGEVLPASQLAALLEVVQPRDREVRIINRSDLDAEGAAAGSGEGSGSETLDTAEIDARLAARQDEVLACYRYELGRNRQPEGVSATWRVNGEGRAIDIAITIDGPRSISFERCFERFIEGTQFPTFDGPPVDARTEFTFERP